MGYDNTKEYERPLFLNGHHIIKHTNDHFMQPKVVENYFKLKNKVYLVMKDNENK